MNKFYFFLKIVLYLSVIVVSFSERVLAVEVQTEISFSECCQTKNNQKMLTEIVGKGISKSCKSIENLSTTGNEESGTAIVAALATSVVTALVEEGVSALSNQIKNYRKSFDGKASGEGVINNLMSCGIDNKEGHYKLLSFSAKKIEKAKTSIPKTFTYSQKEVFFKLDGEISILDDPFDKNARKIFFTPKTLQFDGSLSKRGTSKDIVVTLTTQTIDNKNKSVTKIAAPMAINNLKVGHTYKNLNIAYNPIEIAKIDKSSLEVPFSVKFDVLETGLGKGAKLADELTTAITETLEKEKENIVKEVVELVIKQPENPAD